MGVDVVGVESDTNCPVDGFTMNGAVVIYAKYQKVKFLFNFDINYI